MVFSPLSRKGTGNIQSRCVYHFHHTRCANYGVSGPGIDRTPARVKPVYPRLGQGRRIGHAFIKSTSFCAGEITSVASFNVFNLRHAPKL